MDERRQAPSAGASNKAGGRREASDKESNKISIAARAAKLTASRMMIHHRQREGTRHIMRARTQQRRVHLAHATPTQSPHAPAPIPKRPLFRIPMAILKPSPTSSRRFSTGTLQFSKKTSLVGEHLMPIFFSGGPDVTPPNARSTISAIILSLLPPGAAASGTAILQKTVRMSADGPFEIQILLPFKI